MKLTYVTGNWAKVLSAKQKLKPYNIEIDNIKMETTEIQANTSEEVAIYSAKEASDKLKCNVLKNDTGLYIEALDGFPGPYTHYVEETLGIDNILKMLDGVENRKAKFVEAFAYCEYGKDPVIFTSITTGTISKEKSGKYGWGWDFIFIPDGKNKTLGNYNDEERFNLWNDKAYHELAKYLQNKNH